MSAAADLKIATRKLIADVGKIDGAAGIAGRAKSTVGLWNNLHQSDLPPIDCALAMDERAAAEGKPPSITTAMAHALGLVLVDPPEAKPTGARMISLIGEFAGASGDLHSEFCNALADGGIEDDEVAALRAAILRAQTELSALDAALPKRGA